MKVRMLTPIAGQGWSATVGDVVEFDNDSALRLIESGQAEPIKDTGYETATVSAPETGEAAKPTRKKRG
jgi:hypothetical protein